jgi:hypothetical protein
MQNFEKLGAFYLGKRVATADGDPLEELVLYDSKDLTTHAAIIGMTGSGKTGLGIGLIEEAAMDNIPVIAIDPKGDLGNLLLSFPKLTANEFEPWVDPGAASTAGKTVEEFAAAQAELWKKGLARDGQTPARIKQMRANCDFALYTPGSSAGLPISVLSQLAAPAAEVRDDVEIYNDLIEAAATGLLSLIGIDADPINSKEHILVASVIRAYWDTGEALDLTRLIAAIQEPPFKKIGVLGLDSFYAPKQRFALAMQINNLLAAPGFAAWMEGPPLDIDSLLYTDSGQPRISILSIAHLGDNERMFFVAMLLNALLGWMRQQSGSSSLRAILYIDELFGFMPPISNPPSKKPLLTLLKQARAFGLGLVLSTQNPVDLDYKGLSNTGTWFIGRLQTERDKERLLEGLRSASGAERLDQKELADTLSSLGKRRFLLHNVHESQPVIFATRWVMSYLAGPLTRNQIRKLRELMPEQPKAAVPAASSEPAETEFGGTAPVLEPGIKQRWLSPAHVPTEDEQIVYVPELIGFGKVTYTNARSNINETRQIGLALELGPDESAPDWSLAEPFDPTETDYKTKPVKDAIYADCPSALCANAGYKNWQKSLSQYIRTEMPLVLYKSKVHKVTSEAGETERDFRIRLQHLGNEKRDIEVAKLRKRYAAKLNTLEKRLLTANQAVEREAEQATSSKMNAALSVGTAILGAVLGRKKISVTTASRAGTAMRRAGDVQRQAGDVKRARAKAAKVEQEIGDLTNAFEAEVDAMANAYNAQTEELQEVMVRARSTNIQIKFFGLGWRAEIESNA